MSFRRLRVVILTSLATSLVQALAALLAGQFASVAGRACGWWWGP